MFLRKLTIPGVMLILAFAVSAPAKAQSAMDSFEVNFQLRETKRRALIARFMLFDEAEAEKFWQTYDLYRTKEKSYQLRRLKMLRRMNNTMVGMDEKMADEIVAGALRLELDQSKAKNGYIEMLRQTFSGARYFRLYQIETKLDAIFTFGWTKDIPLAVTEEEANSLRQGFEPEDATDPNIQPSMSLQSQPTTFLSAKRDF